MMRLFVFFPCLTVIFILFIGRLSWSSGIDMITDGAVDLQGLSGYRDDDHAFEDVHIKTEVHVAVPERDGSIGFGGKIQWLGGSVFFFPWFLDLAEMQGGASFKGFFYADAERLTLSDLKIEGPVRLTGKDILLFLGNNRANNPGKRSLSWFRSGKITLVGDLRRLFKWGVRDAFSDANPILEKIDPHGTITATMTPVGLDVDLYSDVFLNAKPLVKGARLLVSYPLEQDKCHAGKLYWDALLLRSIMPASMNPKLSVVINGNLVPLTVCHDRMEIGPLILEMGKNRLKLSRIFINVKDFEIRLKDIISNTIQLRDLFSGMPVDASLLIHIEQGYKKHDRFFLNGKVEVMVAGGKIDIEHIWFSPFSAIPRFGADIHFKDIDLSKITSMTSFGLVTGIVEGYIKNMVFSGIQPEEFELEIRTDKTSKVKRKISIKAIENLSILGGGESSGIPLLGQFFKEFSYDEIGISCRLKNDVFELHGLVKDGEREYLVKRGLFGGVNVVNMNPGGRISFKDMLDRLNRIKKTDTSKMEVR